MNTRLQFPGAATGYVCGSGVFHQVAAVHSWDQSVGGAIGGYRALLKSM
jgi:hypothetical protein